MEQTKQCGHPSCRKVKPFSEFYKVKSGTYGLDGYCKECRKAKNREYQSKAAERKAEYMRRYRASLKEKQKSQMDFF